MIASYLDKQMKKENSSLRLTLKSVPKRRPSEERVRQRAYEIFQARGSVPGQELNDWLQAECEIKAETLPPGMSL